MHRQRNRRDAFDDEDSGFNSPRAAYRRPSAEAEALFSPRPSQPVADPDDAPTRKARIKWFSNEKGYGFVAMADSAESVFLPRRVLGADAADMPPGTTLSVRIGDDPKGNGSQCVVAVLNIDRSTAIGVSTGPRLPLVAANRVEVGILARKTAAGSAFAVPELGGRDLYVPAAIARGLEVGARCEFDVGDGNRGPICCRLIRVIT